MAKKKKVEYDWFKVGSLIVVVLALLWFLLFAWFSLPGANYESTILYEQGIRGDNFIEGMICENDVCFPEMSNLDGNAELSSSEAMLSRAMHLYNSRIADLYGYVSISKWVILLFGLILAVNLVRNMKK